MSCQLASLMPEVTRFVLEEKKNYFIGGKWLEGPSAKTFNAIDPYIGETLTTIPLAEAAEVDIAVRTAQDAFPAWAAASTAQRSFATI